MFGIKSPSLLQFEADTRGNLGLMKNLKNLYKVTITPSDKQLRERLVKPQKTKKGV